MNMEPAQDKPEAVEEPKPEEPKAEEHAKAKITTKKIKIVMALGKRKDAIARANARPGTGRVFINSRPASLFSPVIARMKIEEPLELAGETAKAVDIYVDVRGGGVMGQADAIRQAIALVLIGFDKKLKGQFLKYDRTLVVSDVRRNEPHKPSRSKAGPRRHKQRSKR